MARRPGKTKSRKRTKVAASAFAAAELPGESPAVNPWPKGYRSACLFTFDIDVDVSWVFRGIDDPIALSMGRYEPRVGGHEHCVALEQRRGVVKLRAGRHLPLARPVLIEQHDLLVVEH